MTREEAEQQAVELNAEHTEHTHFARERDGEWEVVSVPGLPGHKPGHGATATEARPRPEPADPRPPVSPNVAAG